MSYCQGESKRNRITIYRKNFDELDILNPTAPAHRAANTQAMRVLLPVVLTLACLAILREADASLSCERDSDCRLATLSCGEFQCECVAFPNDQDVACPENVNGEECLGDSCHGASSFCNEGACDVRRDEPERWCETSNDCMMEVGKCGESICTCLALGYRQPEPIVCTENDSPNCFMDPCQDHFVDCMDGQCVLGVSGGADARDDEANTQMWCKRDNDCRFSTGTCNEYMCQCLALGVMEPNPVECPDSKNCSCAKCQGDPCDNMNLQCTKGQCEAVPDEPETQAAEREPARWCETADDCSTETGRCREITCTCLALGTDQPGPIDCPKDASPNCLMDPCQDHFTDCIEGECVLGVYAGDAPLFEPTESKKWCETADDCSAETGKCGDVECTCLALGTRQPGPIDCPKDASPNCLMDPCQKHSIDCMEGECVLGVKKAPFDTESLTNPEKYCETPKDCRMEGGGCGEFDCQCHVLSLNAPNPYECPKDSPPSNCYRNPCENHFADCFDNQCIRGDIITATIIEPTEPLKFCKTSDDCHFKSGSCNEFKCQCLALGVNENDPIECPDPTDCSCTRCAPDPCANAILDCVEGQCEAVEKAPDSIIAENWCKSSDDCRTKVGECGQSACQCIALGLTEPDPDECSDKSSAIFRCAKNPCLDTVAECIEGQCTLANFGGRKREPKAPTNETTLVAEANMPGKTPVDNNQSSDEVRVDVSPSSDNFSISFAVGLFAALIFIQMNIPF